MGDEALACRTWFGNARSNAKDLAEAAEPAEPDPRRRALVWVQKRSEEVGIRFGRFGGSAPAKLVVKALRPLSSAAASRSACAELQFRCLRDTAVRSGDILAAPLLHRQKQWELTR